ncbi:MAG: hypothetical protein JOY54_07755 [Acidobacteriaceae bacterium]|nr:hypothetical protein [Acidobacteriaceae bacterium]
MPSLYLGIDGGQSSTTALIADETGRVLGCGTGGPCNHVTGAEARAKFLRAVGDCIAQACQEAQLDAATVHFAAVCCGFSGGAEDKDAFVRELIRSGRYKVTHDAEIALTGATAGAPGIIVIAGTGSMAFGRNAEGKTARAGGWGYVFGDEGGAFDLVRRGLRAALRWEEGWGPATVLHALLLESAGAETANALLHRFYVTPRSEIARLAPLVTEAAEAGDAIAGAVINYAASALVGYVEGVYRHLFPSGGQVPVAYIGGVFRSMPALVAFRDKLQASINCEAVPPRLSPAAGAVLDALRLDGNAANLSGANLKAD